ncbi:Calpain clp-1 [Aphelenchoides bicaudatus]|nr:Calpain clp-1 [Aphelenchoides bicaudatus]
MAESTKVVRTDLALNSAYRKSPFTRMSSLSDCHLFRKMSDDEEYGEGYGEEEGNYYEQEQAYDDQQYYGNEPEEQEDESSESSESSQSESEQPQEQPPQQQDYYSQQQGYYSNHPYSNQGPEQSQTAQQCDQNAQDCSSAFNLGSLKDALGGFGSGQMSDVVGELQKLGGGDGSGLSNMLASGGLAAVASGLIANATHHFFGINPETGRIIGAVASNIIFGLGGKHNTLSDIGKIILDNIISGKFKRNVRPFVSPTPGIKSFNLNFYQERDKCLRSRTLFEDPEFPAQDSSLYFSKRPKYNIEWKRPGEIVNDPQLLVGGESRFDVVQGSLGDCWLLAAAANLTLRQELFYRVVCPDQSFVENYAGIFHFQFWRYGQWIDVVIDDRLPTENGELIYMHSDTANEFWSALLEKAYAKLYGSYEALKGGSTSEALEDFTGGIIEYYNLHEVPKEQILALLIRGFQMGCMFGCSIDADPNVKEAVQGNGLVRGHAYSITAVHTVQTPRGQTCLLRIRNPWGNDQEWNGPWSDNAPEWNYISYEQKQRMQVEFKHDGEFWMEFDDFVREFEELETCNLGPTVMNEIAEMTGVDVQHSPWSEFQVDGQWLTANGTAGGCRNYMNTFANNPQYGVSIYVPQQSADQDGKVTVIAAVLQKYRRELRVAGLDSLSIGFSVYELPSNRKVDRSYLESAHMVAKNAVFINTREVTARFRVQPGAYVIIPSTFEPNEDAEFLLRTYSSGQIQAG